MKAAKDYRSVMIEDPAYAMEAAKGEFIMDVTESICEILDKNKIERKQLAERMKKTKGYVSQLLNGSRNMTLNSLAEMAHVLGYTPRIVFEKKSRSNWQDLEDLAAIAERKNEPTISHEDLEKEFKKDGLLMT